MIASSNPASVDAAIVVASVLMVVAGTAKRRLSLRRAICPVCHRHGAACTCRWL